MDNILNIIAALGGVTFFILLVVFIIIILFKKQLNPFIENMKSLKYKDLEISSDRFPENNEFKQGEEVYSETSAGLDAQIEGKEEDEDERLEFVRAWIENDIDKLNIAYEGLQNRESNSDEKIKNESFYYGFLYRMGQDSIGSFEAIEKKAEQTAVYGEVMNILAKSYEYTGNYDIAVLYYEKGLNKHNNLDEINGLLIRGLSHSKFMLAKKEESFKLLLENINSSNNTNEKFENYTYIAELYQKDNKIDFQISALEKALEIKPNDKNTLFNLAYAYSNNNQNKLALVHYKTLLNIDSGNSMAQNNLGVVYSALNLHFNKIASYKKAIELGNTLAASNLAYEYINIGLEEDARNLLKEANSQEDVNENVGKALLTLQSKSMDEKSTEDKIMDEARKERDFEKRIADARFDMFLDGERENAKGEWILDKNMNTFIDIQNDRIIITWMKFSKKYKFEGYLKNRYLSLEYFEMDYKYPASAKEELGYKKKGTAIGLIENNTKIKIRKNTDFVYFTFIKK